MKILRERDVYLNVQMFVQRAQKEPKILKAIEPEFWRPNLLLPTVYFAYP